MSSFNLLGLGKQALLANRTALSSVGQNINNVNTPGYSRQDVNFGSQENRTGVRIESIDRITNRFLTEQMWTDLSTYNQTSSYTNLSSELDNLLASQPTSVSNALDTYFSSMQNVVDDPVSLPNREQFVASANALVDRFNNLDLYIRRQNDTINDRMDDLAKQVTAKARGIAELNDKIRLANSSGQVPNELRDQRDELTDSLSELIGIRVLEQGEQFSIFVGNGQPLVVGQNANAMVSLRGEMDVRENDLAIAMQGQTIRVTEELKGGQIGGVLTYREEALNNALDELGLMAIALSESMNQQHNRGIDLDNQFGNNMFNDMNSVRLQQSRLASAPDNQSRLTDARVEIQDISKLKAADYELIYQSESEISLVNKNTGKIFSLDQLSDVKQSQTVNIADKIQLANASIVTSAPSETFTVNLNGNSTTSAAVDSAQSMMAFINDLNGVSGAKAETAINLSEVKPTTGTLPYSFNITMNGTNDSGNIIPTPVAIKFNADPANGTQYTNAEVASAINVGLKAENENSGTDFSNIDLSFADGGVKILDSTGGNITANLTGPSFNQVKVGNYQSDGDLSSLSVLNATSSTVGIAVGYLIKDDIQVDSSVSSLSITPTGPSQFLNPPAVWVDTSNNVASKTTSQNISDVTQGQFYQNTEEGILAFAIDGFKVTLDAIGKLVPGDRFLIQPVRNGSDNLKLEIQKGNQLALASPVRIVPKETNTGTAVAVAEVTDVSNSTFAKVPNELNPPIDIVFTKNIKGELVYTAYDMSQPSNPKIKYLGDGYAASQPYKAGEPIDLGGYKVTISNQPESGDSFSFSFNKDGVSDNRNALAMSGLQMQDLVREGSYQDLYGSLVERVGTRTSTAMITQNANKAVLDSTMTAKSSVAGVNLDEEAAKLVQFQQAYQASAQLISTSQTLFDSLLNSI